MASKGTSWDAAKSGMICIQAMMSGGEAHDDDTGTIVPVTHSERISVCPHVSQHRGCLECHGFSKIILEYFGCYV